MEGIEGDKCGPDAKEEPEKDPEVPGNKFSYNHLQSRLCASKECERGYSILKNRMARVWLTLRYYLRLEILSVMLA